METVAASDMETVAAKVADSLSLKLYVPTGQRTIESEELIPCFAIPCLGCYCHPHDKCGFAANNHCFCLSLKCKPLIKLLKCGKEENTAYFKTGPLNVILQKPALHFDFEFESWSLEKRNCLLVAVNVGCFKFEINIDDGLGCYKPGRGKCFCCCKCQNKCCCCVQQGAIPNEADQALACFGLACLPGCGCCKTVDTLKIEKMKKKWKKRERKSLEKQNELELERKWTEIQSSKKKVQSPKEKKDKVKIKPEIDFKGALKDAMTDV